MAAMSFDVCVYLGLTFLCLWVLLGLRFVALILTCFGWGFVGCLFVWYVVVCGVVICSVDFLFAWLLIVCFNWFNRFVVTCVASLYCVC